MSSHTARNPNATRNPMSQPPKAEGLQAYKLILYRRAVHPELFQIKSRAAIQHAEYEFEAWVMPGAHVMRFAHNGVCATEIVTDQALSLNERGLVAEFPCAGERDHEQPFGDHVNVMSTVQTETLPENLYNATYRELVEFAESRDAARYLWTNDHGARCASIVDIQRLRREIHAQTYHLLATDGLVLRTQSIFEHK